MRTAEEIKEYLLVNKIAGRYHRKEIREWLMTNFPSDRDFVFVINIVNKGEEITFKDFKKFVYE